MRHHPLFPARNPAWVRLLAALCLLGLWYATSQATAYELSHARQVLLNRGLQIQGLVFTLGAPVPASDYDRWSNANFTTLNLWNSFHGNTTWDWLSRGTQWSRLYIPSVSWTDHLIPEEAVYAKNFAVFQYNDEPDHNNYPMSQATLADLTAKYSSWNNLYPNTLVGTNFRNSWDASVLHNYISTCRPDYLMFMGYASFNYSTSDRNTWYSHMGLYRQEALRGYDGSGNQPIAYAQYVNMYRNSYTAARPSESYVRLQQFASWAFGYTMTSSFVYNEPGQDSGVYPVMFSSSGDSSPTQTYYDVAETNRQSRNLSPGLVRLVSSGIFMKPGSGKSVSGTGLSQWSARAGSTSGYVDYLTGITPYTNSTANGGTSDSGYSDILVGYFKPLLDTNPGCTFADGLHLMVVNGSASGTAAASSQWYHMTFDFTGSDFDELVRLSRDTGLVEAVPLVHTSGSQYYLDLNLPGGTGDLFAFWDSSSPLPNVPEPGAIVLLTTGAIALLANAIRKKSDDSICQRIGKGR